MSLVSLLLLLPEALLKFHAPFYTPIEHCFVNSSLKISVTLVFNLVLLPLLAFLGIKTFRWATEMVNNFVLNINGTPNVCATPSLVSKSHDSRANAHSNGLLVNVRNVSHLFRSLEFPPVLRHSKSLLRTAWRSGFWLSKVLVFMLVAVIGVKSTAWITTVRIHLNISLPRKSLRLLLVDLSRLPPHSILEKIALQLPQCAVPSPP